MNDDVVVRPAVANDREQILELVKLSLGEGSIPRDLKYWSWKHEANPFGTSPMLVAEVGRRIVGLRVFLRWRWRSCGETLEAVRAVDTATHPDLRGRGIFSRLTMALVERMKAEGVSFVFNTPNDLSRPGYLKMGWSNLGRVSIWICPCRPLRLIRARINPVSNESAAMDDASIQEAASRPMADLLAQPELATLLEELPRENRRLTTPLSLPYLRWRYGETPHFEYHAAWSLKDAGCSAVIFRLTRRRGLRELRVCELLIGPNRRSIRVAKNMLRRVIDSTRPDFAAAMAAPRTPERRALIAAGFLSMPRLGPILTVRPLNANGSKVDPGRRSSWRLSIGDLELF